MEISQLRYFLRVAEHQNFTHAANSLDLSQSALSRAIAKLEDELGQPVFERQGRQVLLTDAGELLLPRAQQIIALVEDTQAEITDHESEGNIRLLAIPTIAPYYLPPLLKSFAKSFPKAKLIIQENTTEQALKSVSEGNVDLALLALPITAKYLEIEPLFDEELFVVLPRSHRLAKKKTLKISDLGQDPFVLLNEAHCLTDNVLSFCHQRAINPVTVERTNQLATVQELVAMGHGVSLVPEMARRLDASKQRTYRSLSKPVPKRTIAMCWNPYRFQRRILEHFKSHVRAFGATD